MCGGFDPYRIQYILCTVRNFLYLIFYKKKFKFHFQHQEMYRLALFDACGPSSHYILHTLYMFMNTSPADCVYKAYIFSKKNLLHSPR